TRARAGPRSRPQCQQTGTANRDPTHADTGGSAAGQAIRATAREHGPRTTILDAVRELRAVPRYGHAQGSARSRGIARAPYPNVRTLHRAVAKRRRSGAASGTRLLPV